MYQMRAKPCDAAVIAATPATAPCAARAQRYVLAATIAASSMAFIDASAVHVVLPVIGTQLDAAVGDLQWLVNAYVLVNAALALIGGAAGDRFGRRRVFAIGIAVFTLASIGCGLAADVPSLVAARVVQGAGCALMVPNSLAIVGASFPDAERGRAIGTWAAATSIAGVIAPTLGGWLADAISWRAIFFVNVPIAAVTLILAARHVPESVAEDRPARLDWAGAALAALGLGAVTFALIRSSALGWHHPVVVAAALGGAVVLAAFLVVERRSAAPMMPPTLFRSRAFSGVNAMTLLLYAALSGAFFFIPFDLIRIEGYSAAEAGAAFLPFPLIMAALSRWSGALNDRFGARRPLIVGPLIAACGYALLARVGTGFSYGTEFLPAMTLLGLGMAVTVAPLTATVMGTVPKSNIGVASAINNAVTDTSTLFAISVFGSLGLALFAAALDAGTAGLVLSPTATDALPAIKDTLAGAPLPQGLAGAERDALRAAIDAAFLSAFRPVMLGAAGLAVAAALTAALTIADRASAKRRPPSVSP